MKNKRKQVTLFLEGKASNVIERIRQKFNPKQYQLIKSHITLCREDEIENLDVVLKNLVNLNDEIFELSLEKVKRFSDGEGVLIPVKDENQLFQKLRQSVLKNVILNPRKHNPHITIMHPRNSTCDDYIFEKITNIEIPEKIQLTKISLIEQEIGKKWEVINEYKLK